MQNLMFSILKMRKIAYLFRRLIHIPTYGRAGYDIMARPRANAQQPGELRSN